jgi:hypothetical protein
VEIGEDGIPKAPEKIGGWTNQINGYQSLPIQKTTWRAKKAEQRKKETASQLKIDSLKTTVADTVYD